MDNTQIKQDIDNININVETPSDDSDTNLQELERDNWGRILNNKTFKVMKENFRLIKTSFNNFISNVTNEINSLVNKTNTLENNVNTIQTTVNDLKANGGKINETTLNLLANKETTNTFKEVNTFEKGINTKSINLEGNTLSAMEGETITIGDINKSINIVGKDTTLKYNGEEIKGGGSSGNGGSGNSGFFIGEYPLSTTIRKDSNDVPFLNTRYNANGLTTINGIWYFQADVKKGVKNLSTKNSSVAFYGETLAGTISSDGSSTQNYFELCSVELNDFLKSIFGVTRMDEKIVINKLCGLKFKIKLDVSQIRDTETKLKYGFTRLSSITNFNKFEEFEFIINNEYNFYLRSLTTSDLPRNTLYLDETTTNKVKSITLQYNNTTSQYTLLVQFHGTAFKDLYNSGVKINVVASVYDVKLLKIEQAGGGSGGSSNNVNLSGMLGVTAVIDTFSSLSLPSLTIKKSEVLNATVYTTQSDYLKLLNGDIKIPSMEFNRNANGNNQDTPLVKFNTWDGDTNKNYFIPNNKTSVNYESINVLLNSNINLVPFNNIYGASFDIKTTITKNMSNGSKKVFEGVTPFRIKFKKDSATDLTSLKSSRNNFEHIYSAGYNYGDFLKLLEFNKVENSSLRSELCFKMNLSGARNNLSIYNTVSKTTTYADTYTVFYMTNTMDLFEGDFTTVNIEFEIRDVKVLLKV